MSFADDLAKFAEKAKAEADKKAREIAMHLYRGVVFNTPVDEGRLRGSWGVGAVLTVGPHDRLDPNGTAVMAEIRAALRPGVFLDGGELWLATNLPYARRIEYEGWSRTKAPQGMVRISLTNTVTKYGA